MIQEKQLRSGQLLVIKIAEESDYGDVYELALIGSKDASVPDLFKDAGDSIIQKIQDKNLYIMIAYVDDELIGLLDLSSLDNYVTVIIESVYIRRDYRRLGVATLMINAIPDFLEKAKEIKTTAVTEKGQKFWRKNGYSIYAWNLSNKI